MYGEVTSRNHQAYSGGHLIQYGYINSASVCSFASSIIILLKTLVAGFLLGPGHRDLYSAILIFVPAISRTSCTKTPVEIMVNR